MLASKFPLTLQSPLTYLKLFKNNSYYYGPTLPPSFFAQENKVGICSCSHFTPLPHMQHPPPDTCIPSCRALIHRQVKQRLESPLP